MNACAHSYRTVYQNAYNMKQTLGGAPAIDAMIEGLDTLAGICKQMEATFVKSVKEKS